MASQEPIDTRKHRYPFCVVWTPIPLITWIIPLIGHMGICTSSGVIRDFAGSYYVSEDCMAFGKPTKYWPFEISRVPGGVTAWDRAVQEASEEYEKHVHNLFCDNCHSHVALALNTMGYPGHKWGMCALGWGVLFNGKYVSVAGFLKTWLPAFIFYGVIVLVTVFLT
nr:EOG090X0GY7 [Ilyocryptus agilis]